MAARAKSPRAAPAQKTKPPAAPTTSERQGRDRAPRRRRPISELNRIADRFLRPALVSPTSASDPARALENAEEVLRAELSSIHATDLERSIVEKRISQAREAMRTADVYRRTFLGRIRLWALLDELEAILGFPDLLGGYPDHVEVLRDAIARAKYGDKNNPSTFAPPDTFSIFQWSRTVRDEVALQLQSTHRVPAQLAAMVTGRTEAALRKARGRQERGARANADERGNETLICDQCGKDDDSTADDPVFRTVAGDWLCIGCYRDSVLEREPRKRRPVARTKRRRSA